MNAQTSYVLKSGAGFPVMSADTVEKARELQRKQAARKVHLRLFEVVQTERELP